jgi:hypothetical protein
MHWVDPPEDLQGVAVLAQNTIQQGRFAGPERNPVSTVTGTRVWACAELRLQLGRCGRRHLLLWKQ